jgi:hypothetical protein
MELGSSPYGRQPYAGAPTPVFYEEHNFGVWEESYPFPNSTF